MGLSSSKLTKHEKSDFIQEGSIPSTPILTPKPVKICELDPRSPSTFIARTPIEVLSAASKKLEQHVGENALETPKCNQHILLGIDPRSPSIEFKRTPILISACENELPKNIKNKNLEKVIRSELTTPKLNKNERPVSKGIPPKLLDSSPIHLKPEAYKRKSFVGLLETNIDFTETDIDRVFQEKCKGSVEFSTSLNTIDIVQNQSVDPRSPTTDFLRTPIQVIKKIGEIDLNNEDDISETGKIELENHEEIEEEENCETINSPKLPELPIDGFNDKEDSVRLTISDQVFVTTVIDIQTGTIGESESCITPLQSSTGCDNVIVEDHTEDAKESHDEINCGIISIPYSQANTEEVAVQGTLTSRSPSPPQVKSVNCDMDRQGVHPIYEDDDIIVCPRVVKIKEYEERSPLRIWNGNETDRKKSAQKLKVSDKPRKLDNLCKIPVYKEKIRKSGIQCENTPPRNMELKKKVKPCLWDNADKTLYL